MLEMPPRRTVRVGRVRVQRYIFLLVRTVRLVYIKGKEVHPSLIERVVDLRYHSFKLHPCRIQVPERSRAKLIMQKARRSDKVYIWVFRRVDAL